MNFGDSCWSKVPNHARRFNRVPAGDSVSFVFQVGLGFGSLVFCWNGGEIRRGGVACATDAGTPR